MTDQPLSCPYVFVVGLNTVPDETVSGLRAFNDFYDSTHLAEVLAGNPGFVNAARYELVEPDPPANVGPRWLAAYGVDGETSARLFAERDSGPAGARAAYAAGPSGWQRAELVWRMIWRRTASTGETEVTPERIAMVGMNPAGESTPAQIADFDEFYTGTHLPEIVSGFGYDRGTRFELCKEFLHPAPGCPRYCAIYEAHGEPPVNPPEPGAVALSAGPRAWQGREVSWRLKYRRVA